MSVCSLGLFAVCSANPLRVYIRNVRGRVWAQGAVQTLRMVYPVLSPPCDSMALAPRTLGFNGSYGV